MYSDQAPELKNAVTTLGAMHRLSTPGMLKTNGLVENKVKLVLHGARVLLRQAGFEPRWWPFGVRHFAMARNIENRGDGAPWTRRHGDGNFSGVILPFGCLVDFYPIAPKVRRDRRGGGSKTPSDTLRRLTKRTTMKEETTGSSTKTRMSSLASMLKCELNCLSR